MPPDSNAATDFHLTNYEYWNGAVVVVLWFAIHMLDTQNSIDFEYELAHRAIILSSLGVVLRGIPERGRSSTIPVACKRCIKRSIKEWCTAICPATLLLLKPVCVIPTACYLSAKVKFPITIIHRWKHYIRKDYNPLLGNTLCVIRYETNSKPVLIKHDYIDGWRVTHLIKAYVYRYC